MNRFIDAEKAKAIRIILQEECGMPPLDHRDFFEFSIQREGCGEYRLNSLLGFGGKFRNNGNRDNTPYVDCYFEDETSERTAMIARANERLDKLFNEDKS